MTDWRISPGLDDPALGRELDNIYRILNELRSGVGVAGGQGPPGPKGATGPQGPAGQDGTIVGAKYDIGWLIESPDTGDTKLINVISPYALIHDKVYYQINGGTNVVFNIERLTSPFGAGTDIFSSDLTATSTLQSTSTFANPNLSADEWLKLTITSVSGSVDWLKVDMYSTIQ